MASDCLKDTCPTACFEISYVERSVCCHSKSLIGWLDGLKYRPFQDRIKCYERLKQTVFHADLLHKFTDNAEFRVLYYTINWHIICVVT
jgi:hypothetical protein